MSTNPYAPPTAHVEDLPSGGTAPALWNPNAAANWSLLFSPAFGAFLHMKNWQSLGEVEKAAASKTWAIAALVFVIGLTIAAVLLPDSKALDAASRSIGLILLVAWYFSSGRAQARFVKERFGTTYPRKGWTKPLLITIGLTVGFLLVVFVLAFAIGMSSR